MSKTTYYLFGFIKLWTVTRKVDEDAMYESICKRFGADLDAAVRRQR